MIKKTHSGSWLRIFPAAVAIVALALSAKAQFLGPLNPGFEAGALDWNTGGPGGSGGSEIFSNSPTNGPSAEGTNCVLLTADGTVSPPNGNNLRCNYFSLGAATQGSNAVSVDFDYNILNPFNFGDQVRVDARFEDATGNFLGEYVFHIGAGNNDVGGTGWHHFHGVAADPTLSAVNMDLVISMNIYGDDIWSDGPVLFDNFSVNVTPQVGPNYNAGFETGSANWNVGGPGNSGGEDIFANYPTNGPSESGSNCVMMTADGTVSPPNGNDLRANNFFLGAASRGNRALSVDFDYNIPGPINFGDQVRIGLRFENSGGGFLGEHNFHIGTPNNDTGGTGWHHFHGVASDPTLSAVTADLRISMNIFGDDIWSSGPVYLDNFSVQITPVIGPNNNGNFENGGANWNAGGPGGPGGSESFNYSSNGWSAPGTNCVMMTADGSVTPSGGNDIRVNEFILANNSQPVTISFDYNILNPINPGNQIRVGLRFFDNNNNFNGEHNTYIGTPNGDTGAQGWKHLSATYPVPGGSVNSDIRVSMNIFGDDIWSSGAVLFDNFTVITGSNAVPVANNLLMGTLTNLPVTRLAVGGAQGATDSDGDVLNVSYVGQPAHGTAVTDGTNITYIPNHGYVGTDEFGFAVSDGFGGLGVASATVQVNSGPGANKFTRSLNAGANNFVLSFAGAPDCDYVLEQAGSLTPPITWTPVLTNSADGGGSVVFSNQPAGSAGFWRTLLLP
jgi:hypothetical protein